MGHRVIELLPRPDCVRDWLAQKDSALLERIDFAEYRHPAFQSPSWNLWSLCVPPRNISSAVRSAHSVRKANVVPERGHPVIRVPNISAIGPSSTSAPRVSQISYSLSRRDQLDC
jgi:hypothetical protein